MADYYKHSVFQPLIPKRLLTPEDWCVIEAFGITIAASPADMNNVYLYSDDWNTVGHLDPEDGDGESLELDEEDLFACLQAIIRRSNGELTWISQESAYSGSEMVSDGFGGSAIFITTDDVQYVSTSGWLEKRIGEAAAGDADPQAEDPEASVSQDEKPLLCMVLEGGLVQGVVSDQPEAISCECMVVDYDTEGADPEDIIVVPQGDGKVAEAVGHIAPIALSRIELLSILEQLEKRQ